MLKRITFLCCLFFACFASAKQAVPSFTAPVIDQAGFLSPQERQVVNSRLSTFAASTRGQMGVLIIRDLQADESLEGYSLRAAETWGVGKKKEDTGLLLLIVTEPRLMRIEVGYGWEGQINDARAGDLIRELSAAFRNGRKASGILGVIDQAETMITGKTIARGGESRRSDKTQRPLTRGEQILILIVAGIVVILFIVSPEFRLMVIYLVLSGRGGGRGGYSGGGFGGGGGGGFGGGGASGRW